MANAKTSLAHRKMLRNSDALLKRMGEFIPRDDLASALSRASDDARIAALAVRLIDPNFATTKLTKLANDLGLRYTDVVDGFRRAKLDEGMLRMFIRVPDILEDIAEDARTKIDACPRCDGEGEIHKRGKSVTCPQCKGVGELRTPGDNEARRLTLEAAGIIGKRGGFAQQINIGTVGGLEDVLRSGQQALAAPTVVTVETVETED